MTINTILAFAMPFVTFQACSDDETYGDDPIDWSDSTTFIDSQDDAAFLTYYNPAIGRCGDPMPFYDAKAGDFKVLYLQEYDNNGPCYHPFWGVSTKDCANYESLGEVLPTGSSVEEADAALGTGCCYYNDKDGKYYIYYTGHTSKEVVLRAVSDDFKTWKKDNTWVLDGSKLGFSATDFRDPQIFVGDDGRYKMVIASKLRFVEFTSDDMLNWELTGDFPMIWDRMCECPDIFKMGNYWYLVYSEAYRTSWSRKVKYMMSDTYEGLKACFNDPGANWPKDGHEGILDSRAFYAGKTASNGTDRYIWGWCPYRKGTTIHDKNLNVGAESEPDWSGALVCHKVIQHEDGTLTLGAVSGIADKFSTPATVKVMKSEGASLSGVDGTLSGEGSYILYNRLGTTNHISFTVTTTGNEDKFGISLVRGTDSELYYTMEINPEGENNRKVNFLQEGENGKGFIEGIDGYIFARPENNVYNIDIFTDNSVMTLYINDVCAYTNRIYGIQNNCWSINCYTGSISISGVSVKN